jgi:hypothetical protein
MSTPITTSSQDEATIRAPTWLTFSGVARVELLVHATFPPGVRIYPVKMAMIHPRTVALGLALAAISLGCATPNKYYPTDASLDEGASFADGSLSDAHVALGRWLHGQQRLLIRVLCGRRLL